MRTVRETPREDLVIGLCFALGGMALALITAVIVAPLMVADGWFAPRGMLFAGSIGVTVALGTRFALSYWRQLSGAANR